MKFIDTHCHLDYKGFFDADREEVINRAISVGLEYWINPSLSFDNMPKVLHLADTYQECYAAVGIYPRYCHNWTDQDLDKIRAAAEHPKVIAIGEIGLDYYFNIKSSKETQFKALIAQMQLAKELDLPVLFHTRDRQTYVDVLELVKAHRWNGKDGIGLLHYFNADYEIAKQALDLGLYLSIAGPVTYENVKKYPELVAKLPEERILVETDAPCMPPHPYRALKRSEPAHVKVIIERIACIRKKDPEEMAEILRQNTKRLFHLK